MQAQIITQLRNTGASDSEIAAVIKAMTEQRQFAAGGTIMGTGIVFAHDEEEMITKDAAKDTRRQFPGLFEEMNRQGSANPIAETFRRAQINEQMATIINNHINQSFMMNITANNIPDLDRQMEAWATRRFAPLMKKTFQDEKLYIGRPG